MQFEAAEETLRAHLCLGLQLQNITRDAEMLILFFASSTGSTDDPLADLSEVLNTDDDILGILSDDLVKSGDHSGMCVHGVSPYCFLLFPLYYRCICCTVSVGSALGHFRYNVHILRVPWFGMILVYSTKKCPNLSTFCFYLALCFAA